MEILTGRSCRSVFNFFNVLKSSYGILRPLDFIVEKERNEQCFEHLFFLFHLYKTNSYKQLPVLKTSRSCNDLCNQIDILTIE